MSPTPTRRCTAKQAGRSRFELFDLAGDTADRADIATRDELNRSLRTAMQTDQLELHYQPIMDLRETCDPEPGPRAAGPVWAVEALLR